MYKSNRGSTLSTKCYSASCPHCGSDMTNVVDTSIDEDLITRTYHCGNCGYHWDEYYSLQYLGYDDGYYKYDDYGAALTTSELDHHRCENKWIK